MIHQAYKRIRQGVHLKTPSQGYPQIEKGVTETLRAMKAISAKLGLDNRPKWLDGELTHEEI